MKLATVERIARALNEAGVPYIVVGGLAVVAHGYGRTTQDVDLVVRLEPDAIRSAFKALHSLGYMPTVPVTAESFADAAQRTRWITDKGMMVLSLFSDRFPDTRVDVFVSEPFDFQAEFDAAMVHELAPGIPMRIVRLATLLRLKRQAGRRQDLADIEELRLLHGDSADA